MDSKLIKAISNQVFKRFPELKGSRPQVRTQKYPQAKSASASPTYLLIYTGSAKAANGKSIPRSVRVTANAQGKILKITTSR